MMHLALCVDFAHSISSWILRRDTLVNGMVWHVSHLFKHTDELVPVGASRKELSKRYALLGCTNCGIRIGSLWPVLLNLAVIADKQIDPLVIGCFDREGVLVRGARYDRKPDAVAIAKLAFCFLVTLVVLSEKTVQYLDVCPIPSAIHYNRCHDIFLVRAFLVEAHHSGAENESGVLKSHV
jgi:hypothetical protein